MIKKKQHGVAIYKRKKRSYLAMQPDISVIYDFLKTLLCLVFFAMHILFEIQMFESWIS